MCPGTDLSNPMRHRPWRGRLTVLGARRLLRSGTSHETAWLGAEQASGRRRVSTEIGGTSTVAGFGPTGDGRRAGFRAHLCVDPVYVVLDRLLGEYKPCRDFAVGVACRDE